MKQCPQCKSTYTNDELNFCLSDGILLIPLSDSLDETTIIKSSSVVGQTSQPIRQGVNPLFAYLTVGLFALLIGGGIVAWMKSDSNTLSATRNDNLTNSVGETNGKQSNNVTQYPDSNRKIVNDNFVNTVQTEQNPMPLDTTDYRIEVKASLDDWLLTNNNKDLDGHMRHYADKLTAYYKKSNVSRSYARRIYQKYYEKYSVMNMSISNLRIDVSSTTGQVVTTFDKTFNFSSENAFLEGSVQSEFRWSKINGVWKITSEKDLQVYRVNKP